MLPGPAVICYGTEVGVTQVRVEYPDGSRKEESRTLMAWGANQDVDLLAFYQELIQLRT